IGVDRFLEELADPLVRLEHRPPLGPGFLVESAGAVEEVLDVVARDAHAITVAVRGRVMAYRYPVVQAVPFTENVVGLASLAVHVPWKPNATLPAAGIAAL